MAMTPERLEGFSILRAGPKERFKASTRRYQDIGLCAALVFLLLWALAVALGLVK